MVVGAVVEAGAVEMRGAAFLTDAPRYLFFTGKGGVGKTSLACASAVHLADQGRRVLLVSTDPASNVAQVFAQSIGASITPIAAVDGLDAVEIDPQAAAEAYREGILAPLRGVLPSEALDSVAEQLSGSCTVEISAFNEFTRFLADDDLSEQYDHIVFDTAPTGHTIRLLQLPGQWSEFINDGKGDASCLGPLSGLDKARTTYEQALAHLASDKTRLVLVARAQQSTLKEAARTSRELADLGMTHQHLVINALMPTPLEDDDLARAVWASEQAALSALPAGLDALPLNKVERHPHTVMGLEALRSMFAPSSTALTQSTAHKADVEEFPGLDALAADLLAHDHGLILCMGKGGVGKTTVAAALALALASHGKTTHVSTTDPAAHLESILHSRVDIPLTVSRIDPEEVTNRYRAHVLETKGAHLDEIGRAQLEEDLRSPCTEEVAVFTQFAELVAQAKDQFVVLDTAPTGHTLLLLDAAGSYHREVLRLQGEQAQFTTPLAKLQDPAYTKIIVVTLPEDTPVQEATDLVADLKRAEIQPWAWVVNQVIDAASTSNPLLVAQAEHHRDLISRLAGQYDTLATIPLLSHEPTAEDLATLAESKPGKNAHE